MRPTLLPGLQARGGTMHPMSHCLFCQIRDGALPARVVHRDALCLGFEDIRPMAPVHVLFIPLKHLPTLDAMEEEDRALVGHLHLVAAQYARAQGFAERGYRVLFNVNRDGGQTVFHLHLHLLAGRPLGWPPG